MINSKIEYSVFNNMEKWFVVTKPYEPVKLSGVKNSNSIVFVTQCRNCGAIINFIINDTKNNSMYNFTHTCEQSKIENKFNKKCKFIFNNGNRIINIFYQIHLKIEVDNNVYFYWYYHITE